MDMDEQIALMQMLLEALQMSSNSTNPSGEEMIQSTHADSIDDYNDIAQIMLNQISSIAFDQDPVPLNSMDQHMTTIMIRNIPRKCTQRMLMVDVVAGGYESVVDFVYLPTDISSGRNLGYAFINFIHPHYAKCFRESFHKKHLTSMRGSRAGLSVSYAVIQGLEANLENVLKSASVNRIRNPEYLPLVLNKDCGRLVACVVPTSMQRRNSSNATSPIITPTRYHMNSQSVRAH
jgi:hypothetical protein